MNKSYICITRVLLLCRVYRHRKEIYSSFIIQKNIPQVASSHTKYGSSTCTIPFPKLRWHVRILPPTEDKSQTNITSAEPYLIHHHRHLSKMTSLFNYSSTGKFQKASKSNAVQERAPVHERIVPYMQVNVCRGPGLLLHC